MGMNTVFIEVRSFLSLTRVSKLVNCATEQHHHDKYTVCVINIGLDVDYITWENHYCGYVCYIVADGHVKLFSLLKKCICFV